MAKQDLIRKTGIVRENLSNGKYSVIVDDMEVICYIGGKLKQNKIIVLVGDTVDVELTPYDTKNGRIIYRKSTSK